MSCSRAIFFPSGVASSSYGMTPDETSMLPAQLPLSELSLPAACVAASDDEFLMRVMQASRPFEDEQGPLDESNGLPGPQLTPLEVKSSPLHGAGTPVCRPPPPKRKKPAPPPPKSKKAPPKPPPGMKKKA